MAEMTRAGTGFCANCKDLATGSRVDGERVFPDVEGLHVESDDSGSFIRCRHCGARVYDSELPTQAP